VNVAAALLDAVRWHDVECASYRADLPFWRELARRRGGPLLELGCGTGRVALELAAEGHATTALDSDPELVRALLRRARERGLHVDAVTADVRSFSLPGDFALALAPMQVVQLLGGPAGRRALLERVLGHLLPGGLLAAALADPFQDSDVSGSGEGAQPGAPLPPLPDVRREHGWVLSSMPVAVRAEADGVAIDRLRQAVSPQGERSESLVTVRLDSVTPSELEAEGRAAGFEPLGSSPIAPTVDHVGSSVVLLEAPR
jgi:SAM-dependent methyltransferase